jgi:hypothetical protein
MATQKVTPLPAVPQFLITAEDIAKYAELTSVLTQLEKQKDGRTCHGRRGTRLTDSRKS